MFNINIKDIRELTNQLDLKYNQNKSILDLLPQLQSGSNIKGIIIGRTLNNELICNTQYGRIIIPNNPNLQKGNMITFSLNLNNKTPENDTVSITLNNVASKQNINLIYALKPQIHNKDNNLKLDHTAAVDNVSQSDNYEVKGKITYLNLSNIHHKSLLFRYLNDTANNGISYKKHNVIENQIKNNIAGYNYNLNSHKSTGYGTKESPKITINIINTIEQKLEPNQFLGEIFEGSSNNNQLIKTNFGIISLQNTHFQVGQKVIFEIMKINNEMINNNISSDIGELMIKINNNWELLRNLIVSDGRDVYNGEQKETIANYPNTKKEQGAINKNLSNAKEASTKMHDMKLYTRDKHHNLVHQLENNKIQKNSIHITTDIKDKIKTLAETFNNIKQYFLNNAVQEDNNIPQVINIPFVYNNDILKQNISIRRIKDNIVRFDINLELTSLGKIHINGLIYFKQDTNILNNMDLIVRSNKSELQKFRNQLQNSFVSYKNMHNIKGSINFETF